MFHGTPDKESKDSIMEVGVLLDGKKRGGRKRATIHTSLIDPRRKHRDPKIAAMAEPPVEGRAPIPWSEKVLDRN